MATYSRISGNVKGKNGMPSNVPGGGTSYYNGVGTNLTTRAYPGSVGVQAANPGYSTQGYGAAGVNITPTKVNLPTSNGGGGSSSSGGGYSGGGYSSGGGGGYSGGGGGGDSYSSSESDAARIAAAQAQAAKEAQAALLLAMERQKAEYEAQLKARKEAAQNAYNKNVKTLNNSYNSQVSSLNKNYNTTASQLGSNRDYSAKNINADAESSLRQAYINKMIAEKNLAQRMSAMGLTGGATETTLANMLNNYGNARNNINTTLNNNLSALENTYNNNLSQAQQARDSALAQALQVRNQQMMNLENALSNNEIAALADYQSLLQRDNSNYVDLLKSVIANAQNFAYTPSEVINQVAGVDYQQSNPTANTSNYAALQALLNSANGNSGSNTVSLTNPTTQNNYLAAILRQLGG